MRIHHRSRKGMVGVVTFLGLALAAGARAQVVDECRLDPVDAVNPPIVGVDPRLDCNKNGIWDDCDIRLGGSIDKNADGIPDECQNVIDDPRQVFDNTLRSAESLEAAGLVPRKTLEFLAQHRDRLALDIEEIVAALAVTEFRVALPEEIPVALAEAAAGAGGAGGVVRGSFLFAISSQGLFVGAFYAQAVWSDALDPCQRVITGHTHVGGVINGVCNSVQIGANIPNSCPGTSVCPTLSLECVAVQVQCQQIFGPTLNSFNTPLEVLCPPCAQPTQLPGDCNSDRRVDIGDAICLLGHFFQGQPSELACGDGSTRDPGNRFLLDWNGDNRLDIADAISNLLYLFGSSGTAGPPHVRGTQCLAVEGCPQICAF